MKTIFERGDFNFFQITNYQLNEARIQTKSFTEGSRVSYKTSVFLSHKHSDLNDLKDLIGFFRTKYNVDIYIDCMDPVMPEKTSGETARRIKEIIKKCDRFVLLATNDAIESKWCNWELGFGDAQKFDDRIALFPIKEKNSSDNLYKGNEYMQIYPFIAYFDGSEKNNYGNYVKEGYYVCKINSEDRISIIDRLEKWLS